MGESKLSVTETSRQSFAAEVISAGALQELWAEFRGLTLNVWFNLGA